MALFRRCTLCTSRKSDEIRAQNFPEDAADVLCGVSLILRRVQRGMSARRGSQGIDARLRLKARVGSPAINQDVQGQDARRGDACRPDLSGEVEHAGIFCQVFCMGRARPRPVPKAGS